MTGRVMFLRLSRARLRALAILSRAFGACNRKGLTGFAMSQRGAENFCEETAKIPLTGIGCAPISAPPVAMANGFSRSIVGRGSEVFVPVTFPPPSWRSGNRSLTLLYGRETRAALLVLQVFGPGY